MKQTYRDLEIIIINDGSNDRSRLICQRLMQEDKRIILINNEKSCGGRKGQIKWYKYKYRELYDVYRWGRLC